MRYRVLSAAALSALTVAACGTDLIEAVNTAPTVAFVSPAMGSFFSGGDDISVEISATDDQDGTLPEANVTWWAELIHAAHSHPFVQPTSGTTGTAAIPRVGHLETNVLYRFYAVATDSEGLADTVQIDVDPNLVTVTLESVPTGLEITVDGQPQTTPYDMESVVGMERTLGATTPQSANATSYAFDNWSHAAAATHAYIAPANDVTLTATFNDVGVANVPPTVSITAPTEGATVTDGVAVTFSADATDSDGTVDEVEFLVGTTVVGTDDTAPYSVQWTPSGTGPRSLTARATDDSNATTVSAAVNVTVQASGPGDVTAPTTTLTAPTQGTLGITGGVTLTADATDNVGVTLVEFELDGLPVGTDDTAPYEAPVVSTSDYASGAHTARARARDAAGNWSQWSSAAVTFGGNVDLPAGFSSVVWTTGFSDRLTAGAFAPDGRLFALEQAGAARVITTGGTLLPDPFVSLAVRDDGERGLLGIAFHPNFAVNNYVYLYYTTDEGGTIRNRISRFTANGNVAVANSEEILVELDALGAPNHNGGAMAFGIDGKLYVAVGDNANSALAQQLTTRHGKMLRYNDDGTIPADNPLLGSTSGDNQAIWAYGLRNPFTFGVQPGTGRMHINDVGAGTWEEVNLGRAGANYGWPTTEGPTTNPSFDAPILAYRHSNSPTLYDGAAVVGAAFYNPATNTFGAGYEGDFFFADFVDDWIYRMDSDNWDTAYAFAHTANAPTNLLVGDDGALYLLISTRVERISR